MTAAPSIASTRAELAELLADARGRGDRVGFVPTMGALHDGHASLMGRARQEVGDGPVVVSIFVNPTQFGKGEDLDRYPRTLDADLKVCERMGVDVVFAPSVDEVYPGGVTSGWSEESVTVDPGPLAADLEGEVRPGHFRGVLTVVAKLFGLVRPDVAVFGEKDYQQLALVRRMTRDLCLGVEVVGAETVREPDGLAMSSRNRFLEPADRLRAAALPRALDRARDHAQEGAERVLAEAHAVLRDAEGIDLDYLVLTLPDLSDLPPRAPAGTEARILIAARVGSTRLIDNMPLTLGAVDKGDS